MRIITYKISYKGTYIYVPVPGTILSSHDCMSKYVQHCIDFQYYSRCYIIFINYINNDYNQA